VFKNELKALLFDAAADSAEARVVRMLSERGAASANDLARATGLARSTISTVLSELRKNRVIVETAQTEASRGVGRPAANFALNPEAGTCVGFHLSLSEMRMMIADVSHSVIFEQNIPLERDYAPAAATDAAKRAIQEAYKSEVLPLSALLGVGVSIAGPVAPDGRVQRASILPTWAGVNIREVFACALERPVFANNESNCAAIAEMTWGAAVGAEDFVFFTIDVGVGGAIVSRGRVLTGVAGAAGEFGHMTLDPNGDLCRCGNRGCLELTAGLNPALAAASRLFGRDIDIEGLVRLAEQGDVGCARLIADTAEIAGRGLGMIGAILNPGLFIVGGGAALAGAILMEPLIASYERHTLVKRGDVPQSQQVRIIGAKYPRSAALMGATALVLRERPLPNHAAFRRPAFLRA
jgi:predicted NBD/HSP70 family sugar kinase